MQATTIRYSLPQPTRPKPVVPVRHRLTMGELLRRAAASVDRGQVKLIQGRFRPVQKGRALTKLEHGLIALVVSGLGLAVWLHAQPAPVSAHTAYYQSLARSVRREAGTPRAFAESALQAIGSEWRPATFFASVHPGFWSNGPVVHPNDRAGRIETGLAQLAGHGPVLSVLTFSASTVVATPAGHGPPLLACRVTGQLELADGAVVRFEAGLVQDGPGQPWAITDLSLPPFLP